MSIITYQLKKTLNILNRRCGKSYMYTLICIFKLLTFFGVGRKNIIHNINSVLRRRLFDREVVFPRWTRSHGWIADAI